MNWYKIAINQYQTKEGRPITFQVTPFSESNDRRGWVVHKIDAFVDNKEAGYIKLSYIPREKWDQIYQGNIWKFRKIALGNYDVSDELVEKNDDAEIKMDHGLRYGWSNSEYWLESEKEKASNEMKLYELYFVDKPIVDFISTQEEFRRQRIAYNLHMYASEWLASQGLKLWLSYCRTNLGKCFYNSELLNLRKYRYKNTMGAGYRRTREYVDV